MANTSLPIRGSLTGASDGLKVDDDVVTKDFALGHDIEVVAVSVVVFGADRGAPDFVSIVGAEVGDHDDDAFTGDTSFAAAVAGGGAGGG